MHEQLVITVTAEDIAAGVPSSATKCPIAVALHRPGIFAAVAVGEIDIYSRDVDDPATLRGCHIVAGYRPSVELNTFISNIDRRWLGATVEPGTFTADYNPYACGSPA